RHLTNYRLGSKSAVPSTTEHSRYTFNCGRTVTSPKPSRTGRTPGVNRRRTETHPGQLYAMDVARKLTQRRRNMSPTAPTRASATLPRIRRHALALTRHKVDSILACWDV